VTKFASSGKPALNKKRGEKRARADRKNEYKEHLQREATGQQGRRSGKGGIQGSTYLDKRLRSLAAIRFGSKKNSALDQKAEKKERGIRRI